MNNKIVVIDDDRALVESLTKILERSGYNVTIAHDGHDGYEKIKRVKSDLALLDIDLGSRTINGRSILRQLRIVDKDNVPIIMLTASTEHIGGAFDEGADDYVIKRSDIADELLARMRRLIVPTSHPMPPLIPALSSSECWTSDALTFDTTAHRVYFQEEELSLTWRAMDLLKYLMLNHSIRMSRDRLRDELWPQWEENPVSRRAIDARISEVRRAIADHGGDAYAYIETLQGFGYCYIAPVEKKICP